VVSFEEDTPQRLIAGILPDLLVKGGDYKPEQIAGSEEVWANGGEVLVLNFEDGCSTTNIIKKIQKEAKNNRVIIPRHNGERSRPAIAISRAVFI
jgi:D-beta-D-heptose 7-phosphate kinase/D-beta-D-heptose 1-phosphate adenosyltransferase